MSAKPPSEPGIEPESVEVVAARGRQGAILDQATLQLLREELWEALRKDNKSTATLLAMVLQLRRQIVEEHKAGLLDPPVSAAQEQLRVSQEIERLLGPKLE